MPIHPIQVQIRQKGGDRGTCHDPLLLPEQDPIRIYPGIAEKSFQKAVYLRLICQSLPEHGQKLFDGYGIKIVADIHLVCPHALNARMPGEQLYRIPDTASLPKGILPGSTELHGQGFPSYR